MTDPVILPTSNNVVDMSTICRHLLRCVWFPVFTLVICVICCGSLNGGSRGAPPSAFLKKKKNVDNEGLKFDSVYSFFEIFGTL